MKGKNGTPVKKWLPAVLSAAGSHSYARKRAGY